jgi:hypothetical protein
MPELSRFYGIIVQMYFEPVGHRVPHFHARFGSFRASFLIDPIELLAGEVPIRQRRLIEAWAELHQTELLANWEAIQSEAPRMPIDPLR